MISIVTVDKRTNGAFSSIKYFHNKSIKPILILLSLLATTMNFGQEKYFEVACEKDKNTGEMIGFIGAINKTPYAQLNYPGKNKNAILNAVLDYLKNRPTLKMVHINDKKTFLVYRDFATVCDRSKCGADLIALTHFHIIPEQGYLSLKIGFTSHIYSTINNAKLRISPDDIVVSENDEPFNLFRIVQPGVSKVTNNDMYTGFLIGDKEDRFAYDESIFDTNGKLINPLNKKIIEDFLNGYIIDLKSFLDTRLK